MTIKRRGFTIRTEERFNQNDIYGKVGGLAISLFGGQHRSSVVVNPEKETVTVNASYGSYTLKSVEINSDSTCIKLGLHYSKY